MLWFWFPVFKITCESHPWTEDWAFVFLHWPMIRCGLPWIKDVALIDRSLEGHSWDLSVIIILISLHEGWLHLKLDEVCHTHHYTIDLVLNNWKPSLSAIQLILWCHICRATAEDLNSYFYSLVAALKFTCADIK
jgi:hypothetical protein